LIGLPASVGINRLSRRPVDDRRFQAASHQACRAAIQAGWFLLMAAITDIAYCSAPPAARNGFCAFDIPCQPLCHELHYHQCKFSIPPVARFLSAAEKSILGNRRAMAGGVERSASVRGLSSVLCGPGPGSVILERLRDDFRPAGADQYPLSAQPEIQSTIAYSTAAASHR